MVGASGLVFVVGRVWALVKLLGVAATVVFFTLVFYGIFASGGFSFLGGYGLLGVFLSALFSHLTIIARGLFLPVLLSLTQIYNPLVLGLSAGLGGAIGEVVAYYLGRGIKEFVDSGGRSVKPIPKLVERYGLLVALVFASSPLPDTPIMLLAGLLRFPLWKLVLIQVAGKTILYSAGTIVGGLVFMELRSAFEEMVASIIILLASIALCIIVSWGRSRDALLKVLNRILGRMA